MGNKSGWTRKYYTHYFTLSCIIAVISGVACVPTGNRNTELKACQQLENHQELMADGSFDTIILQNKQILQKSETDPSADIAFYALGEVYANQDFTGRDLALSEYYFQKLKDNFPESLLTVEAKMYINFFKTIAAKEREAMELKKDSMLKEKHVSTQKNNLPTTVASKIVENQNFTKAVLENTAILDKAGNKKPADEALYKLGLIFAHGDNPDKDYKRSHIYFYLLIEQFPDSEFVEEAQIMMSLFDTIEKIQQIDIEIEEQRKKLTR